MADMDTDKRQHRSPSYPFISLERAISRAREFYAAERRHAARVPVAVAHWNFAEKSSGGLQTIAALKQYGLMEESGGGDERTVRLSDLALRILLDDTPNSQERQTAIRDAALRPKLFAEMYAKWGAELPSEASMATYLRLDRGFNDNSVRQVIKNYRDTIRFAASSGSATLADEEPEEVPDTEESPQPAMFFATTKPKPRPVVASDDGTERVRVALKGGRLARLLFTGDLPTQQDIDTLIEVLRLQRNAFPTEEPS